MLNCFLALAPAAAAETLTAQLHANQPWTVKIPGALNESHLRDPRGYGKHGMAQSYFTRRITLSNTGSVPLTGRLLVADGKDWSSEDTLLKGLRLPTEPRDFVQGFYTFWKEQRSHASSGSKASEYPIATLNFWGYTLCGEDAHSLARLFSQKAGIPGRLIALSGHTVGEYFYEDAWHIIDGDQNACYLRLDNRILASAHDIVCDPFLALRTKVFGKHAPMSQANAAFNTSLFEFIEPKDKKPLKFKDADIVLSPETLWPGEKIIYHADRAPARPVGKTDIGEWKGVREAALCLVEWEIDPKVRRAALGAKASEITLKFAYPILSAYVKETGQPFPIAAGEPVFELKVKADEVSGPISVFCQRSRVSFPVLDKPATQLAVWAEDARGQAELSVEFEPIKERAPLPPQLTSNNEALPKFEVHAEESADRLWWQVATTAQFSFVAPNFDTVSAVSGRIAFDPLTATFFNREQTYFLRAKIHRAGPSGAWSEWSAPIEFRAALPARPSPVRVEQIAESRLRLSWPGGDAGTEYLIFGSERLDFLPEPYAGEEIVSLRDGVITETRPNENLLAVVTEPKVELAAAHRFYRIIAKNKGTLSTPSELIAARVEAGSELRPAKVL